MMRHRLTPLVIAAALLLVACGESSTGHSGGHSHGGKDAFVTSLVAEDVIANVTVDPAKVGKVEFHVEFTPPGGSLQQVTSVVGNLIPSDRSLSTIILWFEKDGSNHFHSEVSVPTPGEWTFDFDAALDDDTSALYTTPVTFAP
jgi:hypothetical protein